MERCPVLVILPAYNLLRRVPVPSRTLLSALGQRPLALELASATDGNSLGGTAETFKQSLAPALLATIENQKLTRRLNKWHLLSRVVGGKLSRVSEYRIARPRRPPDRALPVATPGKLLYGFMSCHLGWIAVLTITRRYRIRRGPRTAWARRGVTPTG